MNDNYYDKQYQCYMNSGYYNIINIRTSRQNAFFKLNDYLINKGDSLNCKLIKDRNDQDGSFIIELPKQPTVLNVITSISYNEEAPPLFGLNLNTDCSYLHVIYDSKHHGSCGEFYYGGNGVSMDWRIAYDNNNVGNIRDLIDSVFVSYRINSKGSYKLYQLEYLNTRSSEELNNFNCNNSFFSGGKKLGDDVIKKFFNNDIPF